MKVCTCFLLFRIFAYTNSSRTTREYKGGLDLELDRDLQLNVDKNSKYVSDRKNIGDNKVSRRDFTSPKLENFTDFLREVIQILNTYDDNTLEDFFHILDKEIKKYYQRGYKYHELMENNELRNLIEETFNSIKGKSVSDIKADINEVAQKTKHITNDKNAKKLLNYINSIYREEARKKFRKVITDLKVFGNKNYKKNELVRVIRNGIWVIVFNHYTDLNVKEKIGLKKEITLFLKRLNETTPHKPAFNEINTDVLSLKNHEVEKPKTLKKIDSASTTVHQRRSILRQKTSDELSENTESILETSKEESNSQQLLLTFVSTDEASDKTENTKGNSRQISTDQSSDETIEEYSRETFTSEPSDATIQERPQPYETLHIEDFYKITEKPAIIYKSELKSKLVEEILKEEYTDRLPNARPNTKWEQRHRTTPHSTYDRKARPSRTTSRYISDNDQNNWSGKNRRRSIAPPMPNEELSIEVFDKERRTREKSLAENYNFVRNDSIQHGLKDYIKRRRHLNKKINELKEMYEENQRGIVNVLTNKINNITHANEVKEKIRTHKNKQKESENIKETEVVSERQSNTHVARAQTERNESNVRDTQRDVKNSTLSNKDKQELEKNTGPVKSDDRPTFKLEKQEMVKRSETRRATKTQITTEAIVTKLYNLKGLKIPVFIDLLPSTKKKKNLTHSNY